MILLVVAGVAAGSVAIRIGALQRRAIDEAGMFVPEPKAASMETARVLGSIQQLKLVTVELATHVNSESAEESWRGDVRARVDAPVKLHFGTDLSQLEADQVRRSPLGDQWVVTIPPPQRVATEVFGEREQTDVSVGWLRSRSMSGEKHLGLARRDLYEAARRLELSEKDMLRVRSETREQMGKLMRTIVGPWAGVTVRFTDEVEAAPGSAGARTSGAKP